MGFWSRILRPDAQFRPRCRDRGSLGAGRRGEAGSRGNARGSETRSGTGIRQPGARKRRGAVYVGLGLVGIPATRHHVCSAPVEEITGFSITVIVTLAFGISAATGMFTVVDHVLLRPLPYPHPERLATIQETSLRDPRDIVAHGTDYLDLRAWQERNTTFDQIAFCLATVRPVAGLTFLKVMEDRYRSVSSPSAQISFALWAFSLS